jgi:DNA repair protein RecO (recombination protein O)
LPAFLLPGVGKMPAAADILDGLKLTGYFLASQVFAAHNRPLPAARSRLIERISYTNK